MCYNCAKVAWKFTFWCIKKVKQRNSNLKISSEVGWINRKKTNERNKLLPRRFGNSFRKKLQHLPKMCQNGQNCCFSNKKKVKRRDSKFINSHQVSPIDRKNTKDKSKLLLKWFVNSFRKNPPICARNVLKLPEMSLFKQRKKSEKRIAISEFALQQVKMTGKTGRRRLSFS